MMRNFFRRALLLGILVPILAMSTSAKEQRVKSSIKATRVFLSGAQVTRTGSTPITAGRSILIFGGLSQEADPANIQVKGTGAFNILSVKHRLNYLKDSPQNTELEALDAKIKKLEKDWNIENNNVALLQNEEQVLQKNTQIGGQQNGVSVQQLQAVNEYVRTRMRAIRLGIIEAQERGQEIHKEAEKLRKHRNELQSQDPGPTSDVVIEVDADKATTGTFEIQYIVRSAGWTPSYDLRVENINEPLSFSYRANVYQSTGEDWKNIDLTLSSGDPTQCSVMPELLPWVLDFGNNRPRISNPVHRPFNATVREVQGIIRDAETGEPLPYVNIMVMDQSGRMLNGTASSIDGYYAIAIPNEGRTLKFSFIGYNEQSTAISGTTINLHMSAAGMQMQEVVIMGEKDAYDDISIEQLQSMPGTVSIQGRRSKADASPPIAQTTVQNQVVQRTTNFEYNIQIPYTVPSDGQQHNVSIREEKLPAVYRYYATPKLDQRAYLFAKATGWEDLDLLAGTANLFFEGTYVGETILDMDQVLDTLDISLGEDKGVVVTRTKQMDFSKKQVLGGKRTATMTWEIGVRNNKRQAIDLVVLDQFPVAARSEIEVELLEDSGAEVNKEKGFLTWKKKLQPRADEKWPFSYSVKYPKGHVVLLE